MALIKCNECGKDISDKAESCPHCGNPMNEVNDKRIQYVQPVQSVDQIKGKKWKRVQLYCLGAMILSFFFSGGSPMIPLSVGVIVLPIALIATFGVIYHE